MPTLPVSSTAARRVPTRASNNVVKVTLADQVRFDAAKLVRHFFTSSSCGVCGKASLNAVRIQLPEGERDAFEIAAGDLHRLPEALRASQTEFDRTGGLHAVGVFRCQGANSPPSRGCRAPQCPGQADRFLPRGASAARGSRHPALRSRQLRVDPKGRHDPCRVRRRGRARRPAWPSNSPRNSGLPWSDS